MKKENSDNFSRTSSACAGVCSSEVAVAQLTPVKLEFCDIVLFPWKKKTVVKKPHNIGAEIITFINTGTNSCVTILALPLCEFLLTRYLLTRRYVQILPCAVKPDLLESTYELAVTGFHVLRCPNYKK
jgi:hypothetical protein